MPEPTRAATSPPAAPSRFGGPQVLAGAWLLAVLLGSALLWRYELRAAEAGPAAATWPGTSSLPRPAGPTLVMAAHPGCPCTRASLAELAVLMARAGGGRLAAHVLVAKPDAARRPGVGTTLADEAQAIPGVSVFHDAGGREAARFGATVSGQTLLYDAEGRLIFNGGITAARGHRGDNPGRSAVLALLAEPGNASPASPVFGCELFAPSQPEPEKPAAPEGP